MWKLVPVTQRTLKKYHEFHFWPEISPLTPNVPKKYHGCCELLKYFKTGKIFFLISNTNQTSTLNLNQLNNFYVFVNACTKKSFPILVNKSDKVETLKQKLHEKSRTLFNEQLLFPVKVLHNENKLESYGIKPNSTISCMLTLKGGGLSSDKIEELALRDLKTKFFETFEKSKSTSSTIKKIQKELKVNDDNLHFLRQFLFFFENNKKDIFIKLRVIFLVLVLIKKLCLKVINQNEIRKKKIVFQVLV